MKNKTSLNLIITCHYNRKLTEGKTNLAREALMKAANHLIDEGLLTGETDLRLDGWGIKVQTTPETLS